ncbi:MAG: hypothetical protein ACE5MI_03720 [Acidimicrobiia bacterium]
MVVTMLEARVTEEQQQVLVDQYGKSAAALPPFILETFLLHAAGSDMWRIATVWASQDALDEYRASVETPEGVRIFRTAGAEPSLTIFEVAHHVAQS